MSNPYQILEIPKSATQEEIKKAYFGLIKKYPPEKEPEKFKTIRAAYDSLKTPIKKAEADLFIFKEPEEDFEFPDDMKQVYSSEINTEDILEIFVEKVYCPDGTAHLVDQEDVTLLFKMPALVKVRV